MNNNLDVILAKLEEFDNRLKSMENEKLIKKIDHSASKAVMPSFVYDPYLADYLNDEIPSTFAYKDTKECYNTYIEYRKTLDSDPTLESTQRLFNKMVKVRFPMLEIKHINRNNKNRYIWDTIGED